MASTLTEDNPFSALTLDINPEQARALRLLMQWWQSIEANHPPIEDTAWMLHYSVNGENICVRAADLRSLALLHLP